MLKKAITSDNRIHEEIAGELKKSVVWIEEACSLD